MDRVYFIVIIILCDNTHFSLVTAGQPHIPLINNEESIEEGRRQLIRLKSQMPRYGECWKNALHELEDGCKDMTERTQSQMALAFANCFLEAMGQKGYKCARNEDMKICLKDINDKAFIVYTEFFTHTQNICFFLQSQIWHQETHDTITQLILSSGKVMRQLDDSSNKQKYILSAQKEAISNQKDMLNSGSRLSEYLENSQRIAHSMYDEFRTTTMEQKILMSDVFERISKLQNFMLGEFAGLYTIAFYVITMLVSYLLTSSSRTADARLWLYVIISFNFIAEKYITSSCVVLENFEHKLLDDDGPTYTYIWITRKLCCILCTLVLLFYALTYRDLNSINNRLLLDIKRQMVLNIAIQIVNLILYFIELMMQIKQAENPIEEVIKPNSIQDIFNRQSIHEREHSSDSDSDSNESFVTTFVNFNTVVNIKKETFSNEHIYKDTVINNSNHIKV
ncbi:Protein GAMETE EXPRESSED 1 [Nymphon striatum]|nr:Protein GAMETE EXPRESSED 1 [Nymphon striatum]